MHLLALDTSGTSGSIAILQNDLVKAEALWPGPSQHTSEISFQIERLLGELKLNLSEIEAFAVTVGPGSFTGIRVALSFIKGLAFTEKKPVVGVSSLMALAAAAPPGLLCPLIDAKRDEVYGALFEKKGETLLPLLKERAVAPLSFLKEVKEKVERDLQPVLFFGTGARRYEKEIQETFKERFQTGDEKYDGVRASFVGKLGADLLKNGVLSQGAIDLHPNYLRASEAELRKT